MKLKSFNRIEAYSLRALMKDKAYSFGIVSIVSAARYTSLSSKWRALNGLGGVSSIGCDLTWWLTNAHLLALN
jgi:hypothetical protein